VSNALYFGDNLNILREHISTESIDLIYLDPPFNSKRDYNLLFKTPKAIIPMHKSQPLMIPGTGANRPKVSMMKYCTSQILM
jgi:16S rRNA G966 N2-methylase RsmD